MKTIFKKRLAPAFIAALLAVTAVPLLLSGCNPENAPLAFNVEISNLTQHQPFAPVAAVFHDDGYHAYSLGSSASVALESMAEGGDPSSLISEANNHDKVIDTATADDLTTPGQSTTIKVQGFSSDPRLTITGMLVNTNDGFIGLDSVDISKLARGESIILHGRVYDAGTEDNSESAATVPGQMGEGFNSARDDRDFVAIHPGVVSSDDGLSSSALDQSHRFDNPGARIVVMRIR